MKNVMGGSVAGVMLAIGLTGCWHDNDGGSDSNSGVSLRSPSSFPLTSIATPSHGAQAATMSKQSAGLAEDYGGANESDIVGRLQPGFGEVSAVDRQVRFALGEKDELAARSRDVVVARAQKRANRLAGSGASRTQTEPCELGGTEAFEILVGETSMSYTATYTQCKESTGSVSGVMVINGVLKVTSNESAAGGTATATYGDGDGELEESDLTFKFLTSGVVTASTTISYTETVSWTGDIDALEPLATYKIDGRMRTEDGSFVLTLSFDDFATALETDLQPTDGVRGSLTFNGALAVAFDSKSEFIDDTSLYLGFSNYAYSSQYDPATGGTRSAVDGLVVIEASGDVCASGAYTFDTITPFQWNSSGVLIAGEMTINSNVNVRANSSNGITVTVGGQSQEYADFDEMGSSVCLL